MSANGNACSVEELVSQTMHSETTNGPRCSAQVPNVLYLDFLRVNRRNVRTLICVLLVRESSDQRISLYFVYTTVSVNALDVQQTQTYNVQQASAELSN